MCCSAAAFLGARAAGAQIIPDPVELEEAPPPPAAQPTAPSAPPPATAPPPAAGEPVPLEPSLDQEPPKRPAFLHTKEELDRIDKGPTGSERRLNARKQRDLESEDFVSRATPWVDFSLTSFYLDERVGNFLNLGVQAGGYFFERLRVSARFVTPLEEVTDQNGRYSSFNGPFFGSGTQQGPVPSRSISALYGVSVGLVVSNNRSFVFGPSLSLMRTDVEDYGTAVAFSVPFEWTTAKNLRVGFELSLGQAVGGTVHNACTSFNNGFVTSCGNTSRERAGGTAVVFQYYMGWSLGHL